jgi:hypothetical protein
VRERAMKTIEVHFFDHGVAEAFVAVAERIDTEERHPTMFLLLFELRAGVAYERDVKSDLIVFVPEALANEFYEVRERCEAEGRISREGDMIAGAPREIDVSKRRREIHVERMKFESQFAWRKP